MIAILLPFTFGTQLNISPTPVTAAFAGVFSAVAWPLLWSRFGISESTGSIGAVLITLLVIALPAHAFVVGFGPSSAAGKRTVDLALVRRIGAWVLAAGVTLLIGMALR
jgi:hypothetical protein